MNFIFIYFVSFILAQNNGDRERELAAKRDFNDKVQKRIDALEDQIKFNQSNLGTARGCLERINSELGSSTSSADQREVSRVAKSIQEDAIRKIEQKIRELEGQKIKEINFKKY